MKEKEKSRYGWGFLMAVGAAVLVVLAGVLMAIGLALPTWEVRASFGDMAGAGAALFSGLAFAGVIVTLLMQREELELQREELRLTRRELKGQRRELSRQARTLVQGAFLESVHAVKALAEIDARSTLKGYRDAVLPVAQRVSEVLADEVDEPLPQGRAPN